MILGLNVGDSGSVSVNGGSLSLPTAGTSDLNVSPIEGTIYVGYQGSGSLEIINGGTVTSEFGFIAALSGGGVTADSSGVVTVDGEHSSWTVEDSITQNVLSVGGLFSFDGGTGLLSITNGGLVTVIHHSPGIYAARVCTSGTVTGNSTLTLSHPEDPEDYYARSMPVRGTIAPTRQLTIDGSLLYQAPASTVCDITSSDNPNVGHINVTEQTVPLGRLTVTMTGNFTTGPTRFLLLHSEDDLSFSTKFSPVSIMYPTRQAICPHITYDYVGHNVFLDTDCP